VFSAGVAVPRRQRKRHQRRPRVAVAPSHPATLKNIGKRQEETHENAGDVSLGPVWNWIRGLWRRRGEPERALPAPPAASPYRTPAPPDGDDGLGPLSSRPALRRVEEENARAEVAALGLLQAVGGLHDALPKQALQCKGCGAVVGHLRAGVQMATLDLQLPELFLCGVCHLTRSLLGRPAPKLPRPPTPPRGRRV